MSEQRDYAARTAIHAFYSHELPSPEYEIDISQSPTDQGVPTFHLTRRPRPTATDAAQPTPFRYGEIFSIGRPPDIVLVRHSTGFDEVHVEFTRKDLVDIVLSLSGGSIEVALADPEPDDGIPPPPPHAAPIAEDSATTTNGAAATTPDAQPVPTGAPPHSRPLTGSEKAGILADIAVRYRESVGYSNKLSFDEAFADALKKLPPASVKFADMLETVEVVHIGASFGGIAGFHRLEVRIRAYPD
jgi:hypothetical protein